MYPEGTEFELNENGEWRPVEPVVEEPVVDEPVVEEPVDDETV